MWIFLSFGYLSMCPRVHIQLDVKVYTCLILVVRKQANSKFKKSENSMWHGHLCIKEIEVSFISHVVRVRCMYHLLMVQPKLECDKFISGELIKATLSMHRKFVFHSQSLYSVPICVQIWWGLPGKQTCPLLHNFAHVCILKTETTWQFWCKSVTLRILRHLKLKVIQVKKIGESTWLDVRVWVF